MLAVGEATVVLGDEVGRFDAGRPFAAGATVRPFDAGARVRDLAGAGTVWPVGAALTWEAVGLPEAGCAAKGATTAVPPARPVLRAEFRAVGVGAVAPGVEGCGTMKLPARPMSVAWVVWRVTGGDEGKTDARPICCAPLFGSSDGNVAPELGFASAVARPVSAAGRGT